MMAGSLIVGVAASILAGGGALAAGLPVAGALGCYMLGGSTGFLGMVALGTLAGSGPTAPGGRPSADSRRPRTCPV